MIQHIKIDNQKYTTKPKDTGRLQKEMDTYKLLDNLGIEYIRVDHEPVATVDACFDVEELLGIEICKNLFLCNSKKDQFYLLMMPGNKKFDTKEVSKQIGTSRLSFAKEDYMLDFLNITPGSVSVLGLMNDKDNKVQLLIDKDLLEQEYVGCHPCINTSSLKIKTQDLLEKFLPAVEHNYNKISLE